MSSSTTHAAPQLHVDSSTNTVSMPCCKGYSSCKASHGVECGKWYFEVQIIKGSVRVGWGQALAELQAPIGYDEFGYGFSNQHNKIFHCSRGYPVENTSHNNNENIQTVGCLLDISDLDILEDTTLDEEIKRQIETKYPPLNFLTTYNVKQKILKRGTVRFFADGKEILAARFDNIYRAKYFPTVSIYGDAVVKVNFLKKDFKILSIPDDALAFAEICKHNTKAQDANL